MKETIQVGAHVRIFDEDGMYIGCGVYMGVGPVCIDVPSQPVLSEIHMPSFEMDTGYTLFGNFDVELVGKTSIH